MLAEITSAEVGQSQAGRNQAVIALSPVVGNRVNRDLTLRLYVGQGSDGDDPSAVARTRQQGYFFLRAIYPNFPSYPKRVGKGVYDDNGTTLDYTGYNKRQAEIDVLVFKALEALDTTVGELVGKRVFMKSQRAKLDPERGVGQFVQQIRGELPDGETFLSEGLVETVSTNRP